MKDATLGDSRGPRNPLTVIADGVERAGFMLVLVGQAAARAFVPKNPRRTWKRLFDQLYTQTVKSMLVVSIVGVFTGMVLALQIGEELRRVGGESFLGRVVTASLCREMGPFITATILAATVGGAIAAELGTMRVSDEIDAIELMNIDPIRFLVMPRIIALMIASVLLTVLVDLVGVVGGAVVARQSFGIAFGDYFDAARETLSTETLLWVLPKDIYTGLVKSLIFGVLIGGLGCAAGLSAKGGALGVGKAVRNAVVASVVVTLIVGYLMTWLFWTGQQ